MVGLSILGTGGYVCPATGNQALLEYLGAPKSAAWFEDKTGVRGHSLNFDFSVGQKRSQENALDYAESAARSAMERAGVGPQQIDHLYLATCTPAYLHFMADAIELHRRLGLRSTAVINQVDGACAALAKAMQDVQAYAQRRPEWAALIVAVNDASSFFVANRARYAAVPGAWLSPALFADGAGALLLGPSERPHLADVYCAVDGQHPLVMYLGGGAAVPTAPETLDAQVYLIDGRDVAAQFVPGVQRAWGHFVQNWELRVEDVRRWYLHQANLRFVEGFGQALGIPPERLPHNVDRIGNTSSASTLLLLDEDVRTGRLPTDGPIVFLWVGAGMMEGGALFLPPS
jgi:3-oxoacyl-[acyl-carrier-protein] synthase-3